MPPPPVRDSQLLAGYLDRAISQGYLRSCDTTTVAHMIVGAITNYVVNQNVVPFFGDQLFWGQRVAKLGVGTTPIRRKQLTVELLAQAIHRAVTDPIMRQQAANLGAKIQVEDGIANAVGVISHLAPRHQD